MQPFGKLARNILKITRRRNLGLALLSATLLYASTSVAASALEFKCVEPSRYKNLLQVFGDNPALLSSYFGLDRTWQPEMNACRALVVTGTIRDGDGAALIDNIIRNKGWLDVLYLSFDGVLLQEEIKLAYIIRGFWLKTRIMQAAPFSYVPDFATPWGPPAANPNVPSSAPTSELSPLNQGLRAFAKRRDLELPIVGGHNACFESCVGAWASGVHRRAFPAPPISVPAPAAAAATEIVTARPRLALITSLDSGHIVSPDDPSWNRPVLAGAAAVLPPAVERLIRDKCAAELIAGEALEGRVGAAAEDLARTDFRDVKSTPPDILAQFELIAHGGRAPATMRRARFRERAACELPAAVRPELRQCQIARNLRSEDPGIRGGPPFLIEHSRAGPIRQDRPRMARGGIRRPRHVDTSRNEQRFRRDLDAIEWATGKRDTGNRTCREQDRDRSLASRRPMPLSRRRCSGRQVRPRHLYVLLGSRHLCLECNDQRMMLEGFSAAAARASRCAKHASAAQ